MNKHNWHFIPDNCLETILDNLNPHSIGTLRLVCKSWNEQIVNHILTSLHPTSNTPAAHIPKIFPSLKSLQLKYSNIDIPSLSHLSSIPSLSTLILQGSPHCAQIFTKSHVHDIQSMNLSRLELSDLYLDTTSSNLLNSSVLKSLTLCNVSFLSTDTSDEEDHDDHNNNYHDDGSDNLENNSVAQSLLCSSSLPSNSIQSVTLNNTSHFDILSFLSSCTALMSLTMTSQSSKRSQIYSMGSYTKIYSTLASLRPLHSLELRSCTALQEYQARLDNAHSQSIIHAKSDFQAFCEKNAVQLREFSLHACYDILQHAIPAIAMLHNLVHLELSLDNDEDFMEYLQFTFFAPEHRHRIHSHHPIHLPLSGFVLLERLSLRMFPMHPSLADSLGMLRCLTCLELSDCPLVTDVVVYKIAQLPLQRLSMVRCCAVTDIGLSAISKGIIAHTLTSLNVHGCYRNITHVGLATLRTLRLESLDVSSCDGATDEALVAMMPMPRLKEFRCVDTCMTEAVCKTLSEHCPALQRVDVSFTPAIRDRDLKYFENLKDLSTIVAFKTKVTRRGAVAMMERSGMRIVHEKPCWWG